MTRVILLVVVIALLTACGRRGSVVPPTGQPEAEELEGVDKKKRPGRL